MWRKKRISLKKEAEIMRRLHYFLSSGQGILESLSVLGESYPFLDEISTSVQSGKSFSSSIKESKKTFSSLTIKIIEVGEQSGTLSRSLLSLSDHLRQSFETRSKIINLCIYPVIICFFSLVMVIFLLGYIFPKIVPVFESMEIKLPMTTRLLIYFSHFFSSHTYSLLVMGLLLILCIFSLTLLKTFKYRLKSLIHIIPGVSKILQLNFLISFFRSLGIMLQSQIGIVQALFLIQESEDGSYYSSAISGLINHVKSGKQISDFMSNNKGTFTELSSQFISVGEKTGSLSKSCTHFSEYLDHDFMALINRLMLGLEPVIMIIVGAIVCFISLSLISPLYELSRISAV